MDLLKYYTIKRYVKDVLDMRISKTSTNNLRIRFNKILKTILRESEKIAKEDNRKTIMPRDSVPVTENMLGKKHLSWKEISDHIEYLSAIDLGKLTKKIEDHIQELKDKK